METAVVVNPQEYGIDPKQVKDLVGNLPQIKSEREVLENQYNEVVKLDIEDKETSKKARELRLLIKNNRTQGINQWHKTTKDYFLKGGQFVDAIKRMEIQVNERMEETLEQIEKHFEIQEAKRKEELKLKRIKQLEKYSEFVPFGVDLASLDEEQYKKVFNGSKLQYEAKIEAERKAEEERLKQEAIIKLDKERREIALPYYSFWDDFEKDLNFGKQSEGDFNSFMKRIKDAKAKDDAEKEAQRKENERLRKEAEAKEKALEAEREKARQEADKIRKENEAKLKAQQEANAKIEAELKAKKDAEAKAEADRIAKEKAEAKAREEAKKAPIKNQLNTWVDSFEIPETDIRHEKADDIKAKFASFKKWAKSEIEKL